MKKVFLFLLALNVCVLFSCKKSSDSAPASPDVPAGKGYVSFNYSGAISGSFSSTVSLGTAAKNSSLISVNGNALSGTSVSTGSFVMPTGISTGNHVQGSNGTADDITFVFTNNNGANGWSTGGSTATGFTVNITRNDATGVEGTFSGQIGNDSDNTIVTVTNGVFKGTF